MKDCTPNEKQKRLERRMMALSAVMILLSLFLVGQMTGRFAGLLFAKETKQDDEPVFSEFSDLLAEVYQDVKDKYVEQVDDKKLFQAAVQGMFMALDPHSQYLDAGSYAQLEKDTEGEFTGIGIHIVMKFNEATKEDELTVVAPIPGSPAEEAGLKPWDRIIEIEGQTTRGIKILDAVQKLSGSDGTKVTITVRRPAVSENLHFTVTRRRIKVESVFSRMFDDGILYVHVERFSDNTSSDLRTALQNAKERGGRGLIVDVRNNFGGLLKEAISTSDLFLNKGDLVVSTKGRLKNQNKEYRAENTAFVDWPMLVLINQISASASEIFAGAMHDHARALLVGPKGKRTYGKGSVQTIDPLENSLDRDENGNLRPTAVRLTTARYYTPNGTAIDNEDPEKRGLAPDLEVELTLEQETAVYRHGLLGSPDQVEPGTDHKDKASKEKKDAEGKSAADKDAGSKKDAEAKKAAEKDGGEKKAAKADEGGAKPVVDLQLQFAVEEMNRILAGKGTNPQSAPSASAPAASSPTAP